MDKSSRKYMQKTTRHHLDRAVDHLMQAATHLKLSGDSWSATYQRDLDCVADDLAQRSRDLLVEDFGASTACCERALERERARQSLKQYLDMVRMEDAFRDV